jgi:hypothetical protein
MTTLAPTKPHATRLPPISWLWRIGLIALALVAIRFYARYPLHYVLHQTAESYGPYWAHRFWLRLHVAGASVALVSGPFQLWTGFRRRHLSLHRMIGYAYLGAAIVGGAGAFALAGWSQAADRGVSVFVFAAAWWMCLAMAYRAIRARRIIEHQDWMVRGYVLTYGFVSIRALAEVPVWDALGPVAEPTQNWLGWVVPVLIADVVLRWRRGRIGAADVHRR